uniref:Uncharacterized protein n=1 Tax=Anguilla anguilla TaxID=7936 RepID=A0A0E9VV96_ANGAN
MSPLFTISARIALGAMVSIRSMTGRLVLISLSLKLLMKVSFFPCFKVAFTQPIII